MVKQNYTTMDDPHVSGFDDSEDYGVAEADSEDRLSELPEPLISQILSLLSVREVLNISLVSKLYYSYNDSWTTNPSLEFRNHSSTLAAFRNFVSRALELWKGSKILKFSISFAINGCSNARHDLHSWLRFAIDKQVEELYLNLADSQPYCSNLDYYIPDLDHLYSCSAIRKLSLVSYYNILYISNHGTWDHLLSLTIEGGSVCSRVIAEVLSRSPRLEVLNLQTNEYLNIKSTSLKILKISRFHQGTGYHCINLYHYRCRVTTLNVWAPNLETLELSGFLYGSHLLNVPSLTNVVLDIHHYSRCHMIRHVQYCSGDDLCPLEVIVQVVRSICHAKKVTLSDWCIEALFVKKKMKNCTLLPIMDAMFLKICGGAAGEILRVLEFFPKLKFLILDLKDALLKLPYDFLYEDLNIAKKRHDVELYGNIPWSELAALLHLQTVEITGLVCDTSITPFIANVLQNAHLLEKMVFRVIPFFDRILFHETVEKLLSMPRSSPNAELIIKRLI